ncbi:pilus assembly protein TadE [Naumannella sp. ID2617S]|uniref:Pilus assembly protein TadE n=1 Tax=Enemella dayhoffiae TaxID=2016507 RepID=A0A255GL80_9ACTN|nr:TadE/TadG family type IV pilus assembly protein [Enemella dayhoffiae]NNG20537.1 pilus assembly protein TadE [Naumannella sp. ID2617S]OYO16597.1 pilus assembly protein TadE [Enemella dayhoffiae]
MNRRQERGAAALELAVLTPVIVLVVAVLVGGARVWFARAAVNDVAHSAARAATLARDVDTARREANTSARSGLSTAGLRCSEQSVQLDLAGFGTPPGTPANVTAHVSCRVWLADLIGWGLPGSVEVSGRAVSALDTYRRR